MVQIVFALHAVFTQMFAQSIAAPVYNFPSKICRNEGWHQTIAQYCLCIYLGSADKSMQLTGEMMKNNLYFLNKDFSG